ncbi:MAG: alanine--glyoxylate aminotransferase family protein, partial [bacterium]
TAKCPSYYFCFKKALKNLEKGTTAFTPAVSLLKGLEVALEMIKKETIEAVWCRHSGLANATRAAMAAMGLELYSKSPANVVTAVKVPAGVDGGKITKILRDKYGITIAGGQEQLKGKIFRIATLGWHTGFDVIHCVAALELTLAELGLSFEPGAALAAAQKTLFAADPSLAAAAAGLSR